LFSICIKQVPQKERVITVADSSCALHFAVQNKRFMAVRMLLEAGCSVTKTNKSGDTPLHIACRIDWAPMVRYLVHGGKGFAGDRRLIYKTNSQGETPLQCAFGFKTIRDMLIQATDEHVLIEKRFLVKRSEVEKLASLLHSEREGELDMEGGTVDKLADQGTFVRGHHSVGIFVIDKHSNAYRRVMMKIFTSKEGFATAHRILEHLSSFPDYQQVIAGYLAGLEQVDFDRALPGFNDANNCLVTEAGATTLEETLAVRALHTAQKTAPLRDSFEYHEAMMLLLDLALAVTFIHSQKAELEAQPVVHCNLSTRKFVRFESHYR
jgi:hypothetical protein